jgi:hypothetical protein
MTARPNRRPPTTAIAPAIEPLILVVRGRRVMIDADLGALYGVPTRRLNEQVRRNVRRFPEDFCFRLAPAEKAEVVANCDHLARLKFSPSLPFAFTEHGAIMAANVLNSPRAVEMSVHVVRAFVRLREVVASHRELVRRVDELESRYDGQFKVVFDALRGLMAPPEAKPKRKIGFV